jgi:CheY-like chemotaxis protein
MDKLTNPVILLVDDDADDRDIFCELIGELDGKIKCIAFPGCREVLTYLAKKPLVIPDFIFLDLNMPSINGIQCMKRMMRLAHIRALRVIIYSTSKNPEDRNAAQRGGAQFLVKQGHLSLLKEELRRIIQK